MKKNKLLIIAVVLLAIGFAVEGFFLFRLQRKIAFAEPSKASSSSMPFFQSAHSGQLAPYPFSSGTVQWGSENFFDGEWDPFKEMERIQREINRMFKNSFGRGRLFTGGGWLNQGLFDPDLDIKEDAKRYIITMDIPGMEKGQIDVEVKGRQLIVSGERANENTEEQAGRYFRKERRFGQFMRSITLPEDADTTSIKAEYKKGVLTITVAKKTAAGPKSTGSKIKVL